ncbi:DNA internalization-related competence protein ComEC/Rec2 [Kineothrix sedimenti]|uniref:DNA internalization-related competence protein ComEC/Rec2 n=1 Tax=Kineothrix sedimenti TaxID=3123317 RepID=A0ABZ3EUA6_9FIRM
MRRPLCLFCLTFVVTLVFCMRFIPMPVPDYGSLDGQQLLLEGQVYQKEYRIFEDGDNVKTVLILYLKSIHIPSRSEHSIKIPQERLQNIMCYMASETEPSIGNTVRVEGTVQCFREASNPGEFDVRDYYRIMKLDFKLNKARLTACSMEYDKLREGLYLIKKKFSVSLDKCFNEEDASIMKAMLLGDTGNMDEEIKELYKQSGIIHILAISGMHISMIGMGLYKLLTSLRVPDKLSVFICIGAIWCYGIMTGMGASAMRAIVMFGLHFVARMIGRTYDMLTSLSLAAVLLLIEQPRYVEHSGFLFSFGAIAALGLLMPVLWEADRKPRGRGGQLWKGARRMRQALASGGAVALAQLPVHLIFYYQFPMCSILINLIIIPLSTIVMYNGMFCMLTGDSLTFIARKAAYINSAILWIYEKSCMLCEKAAYGNIIAGKPERWQVEIYILMLAFLSAVGRKMSSWWKAQWIIVALALLIFRNDGELSITVLDVGQGDSIHIRSEAGMNYLIDGGSTSKSDVGNYQLIPYLKSQGVERLEAVFVTHADADHYNGIETLMEASDKGGIKIAGLILPDIGESAKSEAYEKLIKEAKAHRINVRYMSRGQFFENGEMRITCVHPYEGYDTSDTNEYSLVLYLRYENFSALFTGDVEGEGEEQLKRYMGESGILQGTISLLKVAHHGSGNSTSEELLKLLHPRLALISCAEKNSYGHPHPDLLDRLENQKCEVYITKDKGAITVHTDGRRIEIGTFK